MTILILVRTKYFTWRKTALISSWLVIMSMKKSTPTWGFVLPSTYPFHCIELFCQDCPTWNSKWDLWKNKKENWPEWHALPRRTRNLWGSPRLLLRGGGSPCTQAAWHSSLHRYLRYNIIAQILVSCWSFVYFLVWDFRSFFLFGFVIVLHI